MKRNGLSTSIRELEEIASNLKLDAPVGEEDKHKCQKYEIPIVNPSGCADDWAFEMPAS